MSLGMRIISTAFQNKVKALEQEIKGIKLTCEEQRSNLATLERKNSGFQVELVECHQQSQQLTEENKELFKTVGSLRKQITRLENLKQEVLKSIQDDQLKAAELGDTKVLMSDEYLRGSTPLTAADMGYGAPCPPPPPPPQPIPQAQSARLPERLRPASPVGAMASHPPTTYRETQLPYEPIASQPVYAPSPMAGGPSGSPVVDGKQFFRQARSRLSYEAFNLFLASIKRLNNQQQTREETLEEARRIFGPELLDLYKDFEALLNRHGM